MTGSARPAAQPDLATIARRVDTALVAIRAHDAVPTDMLWRVVAVDDARLVVLVGGLTDEFLAGVSGLPETIVLTHAQFTTRTLDLLDVLMYVVAHTIRHLFPDLPTPPCEVEIGVQTEAQWRTTERKLTEAVTVVRNGTVVR